MARRSWIWGTVVTVAVGTCAVAAAAGYDPLDGDADPGGLVTAMWSGPAELGVPGDVVTVFQIGEMSAAVRDAVAAAASRAGAAMVTGRGFSVGLVTVRRGDEVLQRARAAGWGFPMAVTALPRAAISQMMGRDIAGRVGDGQVVISETSAALRAAVAGDVLELRAADGSVVSFTIGFVAPDETIGGTEILIDTAGAKKLGAVADTRALVLQIPDRGRLDAALDWYLGRVEAPFRVRRTWDPPDPDLTLGLGETKALLGEFDLDYAHLSPTGWTAMSPEWVAAYLPPEPERFPMRIMTRCHALIESDLRAALREVREAGLGYLIDIDDTNEFGGCGRGEARYSRGGASVASVSRHSWAQALDVNTVDNCVGCVPVLDCRIVGIFRKHGFAWGGNFLRPDGMHFEWVGEVRNRLPYPSRYCPNNVALPGAGGIGTSAAEGGIAEVKVVEEGAARLFVEDGWSG